MRFYRCIKLKKRCVSFVFALLVSFASLLPYCISVASADTISSSSSDYVMQFAIGHPYADPNFDPNSNPVPVPCASVKLCDTTPGDTVGVAEPWWLTFNSNFFKPKSYNRTVCIAVGYVGYGSSVFTGGNPAYLPDVIYSKEDVNDFFTFSDGVILGGYIYQNITEHGEVASIRVTIPAEANSVRFNTENYLWWVLGGGFKYDINCYGAYVVDTTDDDILNSIDSLLQDILSNVENTNTNVANISTAVSDIVNHLIAINAKTVKIINILDSLNDLSDKQLTELERISFNTDAIVALLADALQDETEAFDNETQELANSIQESSNSEARWQANMQGSYQELNIANTNFGNLNGSIVFVMRLFEDMLDTFGAWSILFTFPLTIGIALLVIGRINKTGGGNSSRNSEHKGGEGGA